MSDRQRLVDQLIRHEGLRLFPYTDTAGKITIGVGRNLTDVGISDAEALDFLDHDVDVCVADLAAFPWFRTLDSVRQRALVDLRFNIGATGFRSFHRMLDALAQHDYLSAAAACRHSLWFKQVKSRGPVIVAMLETGADA